MLLKEDKDESEIREIISQLKRCKSRQIAEGKNKNGNKSNKIEYFPLVGDPCYKFSRLTKEVFLKNEYCAFLFVLAQDFLKEKLVKKG